MSEYMISAMDRSAAQRDNERSIMLACCHFRFQVAVSRDPEIIEWCKESLGESAFAYLGPEPQRSLRKVTKRKWTLYPLRRWIDMDALNIPSLKKDGMFVLRFRLETDAMLFKLRWATDDIQVIT